MFVYLSKTEPLLKIFICTLIYDNIWAWFFLDRVSFHFLFCNVKFMISKKATEFDLIFHMDLTM